MGSLTAFDDATDLHGCLLWRIRGADRALYAMFLRRVAGAWTLDLYRDGAHLATYEHQTRDRAMRDARHVFVVCQVPSTARLWECTGWDGQAVTVHIEHCGEGDRQVRARG